MLWCSIKHIWRWDEEVANPENLIGMGEMGGHVVVVGTR